MVAGRQRSRGQLLQLAPLLPVGALVGQWMLLQLQPLSGWRPVGATSIKLDELGADALLLGFC